MRSSSRFAAVATFLLFVFATWSPPATLEAVGLAEPLRYAFVLATSGSIILHAQLRGQLAIHLAPEWVLLITFFFFVAASSIWSEGGINAAIKGGLILSTTLTCVAIVNTVRLQEILTAFYRVKALFLILSVIAVVVSPATSIETGWQVEGEWKGVFGQKNGLGATASIALIAALALPLPRHTRIERRALALILRLAIIVIAVLCLYMAGSRGAGLLAAVGVLCLLIARAPKLIQRVLLIATAVGSILLLNLVAATVELTADDISAVGITVDTNSRTTLWGYGIGNLDGREFLGFGVDGFWTEERILAFKATHGWVLDNFHNGYVTILVEQGLTGLLLLAGTILSVMTLYVIAIGQIRNWHLALAFAWITMFLMGNLVENSIGRSTSSTFMLFLLLSLGLRAFLAELRFLHPRPPAKPEMQRQARAIV